MTTELDDPHVEERLADLDRRLRSLEAVLWPTGGTRPRTNSSPSFISPRQPSQAKGPDAARRTVGRDRPASIGVPSE